MKLKKIFVASFHRASDGAVSKIGDALEKEGMLAYHLLQDEQELFKIGEHVDYILACGDRKETFEFCLEWYGKIPIIHLWAGELSQGTHDEIYRWAITNMSMMQLCTNEEAQARVNIFCRAISKDINTYIVGNVMLDNMPPLEYDVVLYNPPSLFSQCPPGHVIPLNDIKDDSWKEPFEKKIEEECNGICEMLGETYFWIEPNGDAGSGIVAGYVNTPNLGRPQFLSLVSNCRSFISNSSCIDYEIKHMLKPEQIVRVGERNKGRESMTSDMSIPDATENIIKILKEL